MKKLSDIDYDKELLEFDIDINDSNYEYNGVFVPRVTKILSSCLDNNYLVEWAGKMFPSNYDKISNSAKKIGTEVHDKIENFLLSKFGLADLKPEKEYLSFLLRGDEEKKIDTAFNNFKFWYNKLFELGFFIEEVYGVELPVVCPWYGGTIDAILKINGFYYVVDFKTSKQISLEHQLQTSAYMWAINNGYTTYPHVSGIGIIRVDKSIPNKVDDLFYNENIPQHAYILNQFQRCFCSMVDTYYRSHYTEDLFKQYNSGYQLHYALEGNING